MHEDIYCVKFRNRKEETVSLPLLCRIIITTQKFMWLSFSAMSTLLSKFQISKKGKLFSYLPTEEHWKCKWRAGNNTTAFPLVEAFFIFESPETTTTPENDRYSRHCCMLPTYEVYRLLPMPLGLKDKFIQLLKGMTDSSQPSPPWEGDSFFLDIMYQQTNSWTVLLASIQDNTAPEIHVGWLRSLLWLLYHSSSLSLSLPNPASPGPLVNVLPQTLVSESVS
jgi:hypothetical protein